jgi:hypothetical protein
MVVPSNPKRQHRKRYTFKDSIPTSLMVVPSYPTQHQRKLYHFKDRQPPNLPQRKLYPFKDSTPTSLIAHRVQKATKGSNLSTEDLVVVFSKEPFLATGVKTQSNTRNMLAKKDLENRRREKAATSLQRIWRWRGFSQHVLFQLVQKSGNPGSSTLFEMLRRSNAIDFEKVGTNGLVQLLRCYTSSVISLKIEERRIYHSTRDIHRHSKVLQMMPTFCVISSGAVTGAYRVWN